MKILIAPDKFKGSLTSFEVCKAIHEGINQVFPQHHILEYPLADGGDGFAAVMQHYLHTEKISCQAMDSLFRTIDTSYQLDISSHTAIIETASASGLTLLNESERNPLQTTTFGTGMMIKHAIESGAREIILGLGGTATNDAGTGILAALGFRFFDKDQQELPPTGQQLSHIHHIKGPATLPSIKFRIACDVTNPMFGEDGAAYVYAPQKGANTEEVKILDKGLRDFAEVLSKQTGFHHSQLPGTGAAGAIAAGLKAFFPVEIEKGIDIVLAASQLKKELNHADLIITGEGKIDNQTSEGKVAGTIAALAKNYAIPCIAISGRNELSQSATEKMGFNVVYAINDGEISHEESMNNAASLIQKLSSSIMEKYRV